MRRPRGRAPVALGGLVVVAGVPMSEQGVGGARDVVREGLRRVVGAWGEPPAAGSEALRGWQNRLLDEVGSDRRGLVQLVLRVHADGLASEIPRGPFAPAAWATIRARLAFGYASSTYLDGDMARWAVDAWAYALGVIDARGLYTPVPAAAPGAASPAAAAPRVAAAVHPPQPTAALAPQPVAAAHKTAGYLPVGRKVPGRVRRAIARANAPPAPNPFPANFDRLAGYAFFGMFAVAATAMWIGIAERREAGGLEVRPAATGASLAALVDGRRTPARAEGAQPLPSAPGLAMERAAPTPPNAVLVDSLRLRDGTVRTGRVERITPTAIALRDVWSDGVEAVALDDVLELRTRHGEVLPVGDDRVAPTPRDGLGRLLPPGVGAGVPDAQRRGAADAGGASRAAGFGGRYAVRQELLAVGGSASCDAVADAVRQAAPTVETVAHAPGASTFALTSRPGVRGTVDDDGRFRTGLIEGTRDGVHYWFRMAGRFAADGFQAEAESATDAVLKFGSVQRCRVSASLDARRLP